MCLLPECTNVLRLVDATLDIIVGMIIMNKLDEYHDEYEGTEWEVSCFSLSPIRQSFENK